MWILKKMILLAFVLSVTLSIGQVKPSPLFESADPIVLKIRGSIKNIKRNSNDSTYISNQFLYQRTDGEWDSIKFLGKVRGNFRLRTCYFPPIKLKLKAKDVKNSPFQGNKNLKLVVPCLTTSDMNELVLKEYLCYRFYEMVTPYHFKTRLANLNLTETSKKKERDYALLSFFVEDNESVAERNGGKILKDAKLHPLSLEALNTVRQDFFQFMIGNVDWSSGYQHNSNILSVSSLGKIPLAYDFDMSGFVNASYARQNAPAMSNGDITERIYRGFCRDKVVMNQVRNEYLKLEPSIFNLVERYKGQFTQREFSEMQSYLKQFFDILHDEGDFENQIIKKCRTNQ